MNASHEKALAILSITVLGAIGILYRRDLSATRSGSDHAAKTTTFAAETAAEPESTPGGLTAPDPPQPLVTAAASAPSPTPPPRARKEDDPHAPFAIAGETERDRAERARERDDLTWRWQNEVSDPAWANEGTTRIQKFLADARQPPGALQAVDCRQSLCRFELHSRGGTQGEVLALVHAARQLEDETWVHPVEQPDGTWHMETFFPKQGYRLSGGGGRIGRAKQVSDSSDLPLQPSTEKG